MLRVGIDTGGTFTDLVVFDGRNWKHLKVLSSPENPAAAVLEGLGRIEENLEGATVLLGSTVAGNAVLERRGARCVLITNQGFEDILEIGRQNRPYLYSLTAGRPKPLVPEQMRIGMKERRAWDGTPITNLEPKSLDWLRSKVQQLKPESVAVVLLYSYVNPESEKRIAEALQEFRLPVSLSHEIHPEFREYERTSTTVVNAYVQPIVQRYLDGLVADQLLSGAKFRVMQSNGGTTTAGVAARESVRTLFSGPAAGVLGAFEAARRAGYDRIITLDMGGTSTDVCLCDGAVETTAEAVIDHHPVAIQTIPIHSIGAGGGSVAWVDEAGLLKVGPRSAGADPGPICYGKGSEVTVTDANLYLGRLDPEYFLGGTFKLHPEPVKEGLRALAARLAEAGRFSGDEEALAEGILQIIVTQMQRAVRRISLRRGHDTRDFTLVAFGGAGPLHAYEVARALEIPRILIPASPGTLSARGILGADLLMEASRSVFLLSSDGKWRESLHELLGRLEKQMLERMEVEGFPRDSVQLERSVDARYLGQSFEITIPMSEDVLSAFHARHCQLYGYNNPELVVEMVNVRVRGRVPTELPSGSTQELEGERPPRSALVTRKTKGRPQETGVKYYLRERLKAGNRISGPAVVLEYSSTTWVPAGASLEVDPWLNLVLTVAERAPQSPPKHRTRRRRSATEREG